jgi:hypothetical protein
MDTILQNVLDQKFHPIPETVKKCRIRGKELILHDQVHQVALSYFLTDHFPPFRLIFPFGSKTRKIIQVIEPAEDPFQVIHCPSLPSSRITCVQDDKEQFQHITGKKEKNLNDLQTEPQ